MLSNLLDEPYVYLEISHPNGRCYGVMPGADIEALLMFNRHAFKILPTNRRRKFYLDYDIEVPGTNQPDEEHDRVLLELQDKAVTDVESVCGPGRAVLSGSWGEEGR